MPSNQSITKKILGERYGVEDRTSQYSEKWSIAEFTKDEESAKQLAEELNKAYENANYVAVKYVEVEFIITDIQKYVIQ